MKKRGGCPRYLPTVTSPPRWAGVGEAHSPSTGFPGLAFSPAHAPARAGAAAAGGSRRGGGGAVRRRGPQHGPGHLQAAVAGKRRWCSKSHPVTPGHAQITPKHARSVRRCLGVGVAWGTEHLAQQRVHIADRAMLGWGAGYLRNVVAAVFENTPS